MGWKGLVVLCVLLWTAIGGSVVAAAQIGEENPACHSPSKGFEKSVQASSGTSLERAGPGLINARSKIGCETIIPS